MDNRTFFKTIATLDTINAELREYAEQSIKKMDEKNAKRKATPSKLQRENATLKQNIVELFAPNMEKTASAIGSELSVSTQKASSLLKQLETEKVLVAVERKSGKSKAKYYSLAAESEADEG